MLIKFLCWINPYYVYCTFVLNPNLTSVTSINNGLAYTLIFVGMIVVIALIYYTTRSSRTVSILEIPYYAPLPQPSKTRGDTDKIYFVVATFEQSVYLHSIQRVLGASENSCNFYLPVFSPDPHTAAHYDTVEQADSDRVFIREVLGLDIRYMSTVGMERAAFNNHTINVSKT